ncbi:MAG: helix-turn-helix domain-containing protein, partial [Acidobacteriota bacterium]
MIDLSRAFTLILVFVRTLRLSVTSTAELRAEILFLRRQLAMYVERGARPRRPSRRDRIWLVVTSRLFAWREALVVVKTSTLIRWQRVGIRALWRWKSRATGRPPIPADLRAIIQRMSRDNPTWGTERIANELRLKLGLRVSPRTIRKVLGPRPRGRGRHDQRWST